MEFQFNFRSLTEPGFERIPASLLAAACVAAAVKGFHWSRGLVYPAHHRDELILVLASLVGHTPVCGTSKFVYDFVDNSKLSSQFRGKSRFIKLNFASPTGKNRPLSHGHRHVGDSVQPPLSRPRAEVRTAENLNWAESNLEQLRFCQRFRWPGCRVQYTHEFRDGAQIPARDSD